MASRYESSLLIPALNQHKGHKGHKGKTVYVQTFVSVVSLVFDRRHETPKTRKHEISPHQDKERTAFRGFVVSWFRAFRGLTAYAYRSVTASSGLGSGAFIANSTASSMTDAARVSMSFSFSSSRMCRARRYVVNVGIGSRLFHIASSSSLRLNALSCSECPCQRYV